MQGGGGHVRLAPWRRGGGCMYLENLAVFFFSQKKSAGMRRRSECWNECGGAELESK